MQASRPSSASTARLAAALLLASLVALPSERGDARQNRKTWTDYGGGPDNARYMALDQITKANVARLEVAWTYPTRDDFSYVFSPLVVDNVMYVLARNSALVALDATRARKSGCTRTCRASRRAASTTGRARIAAIAGSSISGITISRRSMPSRASPS